MRCSKCNSDNVFVKKGKCFCFECFDFTEVNPSDKLDDYVNKREINADYFQVNMPRLQSELNKFADFEKKLEQERVAKTEEKLKRRGEKPLKLETGEVDEAEKFTDENSYSFQVISAGIDLLAKEKYDKAREIMELIFVTYKEADIYNEFKYKCFNRICLLLGMIYDGL
jgi:hypothetical protein